MNNKVICNYFDGNVEPSVATINQPDLTVKSNRNNGNIVYFKYVAKTTVEDFQQYLAAQYAAGTPVTVYYPLETPVEEDWPDTTYNTSVYIPQNQSAQNN